MTIKEILDGHAIWVALKGEKGQHADLRGADLRGADLRGADLRCADLRCANLRCANLRCACFDLSCWPLHCGSFSAKADKRLVAQLAKHLAMLDVSECDTEVQEAMTAFRKMPIASWFDNFRGDVDKTPTE